MAFASTRTIGISGAVLVGGLVTGMLLAAAMPTDMKRKAENWREVIGVREVAVEDATLPVYAPPQDLTPVHWQTAADEYPSTGAQDAALASIYADADDAYLADTTNEAIPVDREQSSDIDLAASSDDAAASAEAASAAAAEVQLREGGVNDPAAAPTPEAIGAA